MIKLQRMGIVLAPEGPEIKTTAKFNAGMVLVGGTVHMLFRYCEWREQFDTLSQSNYAVDEIRYARLTPGGRLLEESTRALIAPTHAWEVSGCQDARVVALEDSFYITYTAWDKDTAAPGEDRARVGVARTEDFKTIEKLGIISHERWDKDAFLFPERIGGRIAYMHRVEPNIQIDYFSSIAELLDPRTWQNYAARVDGSTVLRAENGWECGKVGGSVPPIRTERGWLLIYHAVETLSDAPLDFVYRAGAALLDLDNPSKVIARLPYPILEPETDYERVGDVDNVVFPVGGYIFHGDLVVSYGAADRVTALAKVNLVELLDELEKYKR
jgi:beta-1,2-mannobiose phosphorylase / 1,2-beta-oligomannan phosphorylase